MPSNYINEEDEASKNDEILFNIFSASRFEQFDIILLKKKKEIEAIMSIDATKITITKK